MADAYLEIARKVLKSYRVPMTAREMINAVQKISELPNHLHGETMHKTLQARISEDIVKYQKKSIFFRVRPGVFYLREFLSKNRSEKTPFEEYYAVPRTKSAKDKRILCFEFQDLPKFFDFSPYCFWSIGKLHAMELMNLLSNNFGVYAIKKQADEDMKLIQVSTLTIFSSNNKFLVHGVGKYTDGMQDGGAMTIFFHNYITEFDIDLMNDDLIGVKRNSARECIRHIVPNSPTLSDIDIMSNIEIVGGVYLPRNRFSIVCVFNLDFLDVEIKERKKALGFLSPSWMEKSGIQKNKMNAISDIILDQMI